MLFHLSFPNLIAPSMKQVLQEILLKLFAGNSNRKRLYQ